VWNDPSIERFESSNESVMSVVGPKRRLGDAHRFMSCPFVASWSQADLPAASADLRFRMQSGLNLLAASISASDPNVWSGRALQEGSLIWQMRPCINVSGL
jgi:hypothetical protein